MKSRAMLVLAIVAVSAAVTTAGRPPPTPTSPSVPWEVANRAVVVTAKLAAAKNAVRGSGGAAGSVTMFIPRPDKSKNIIVNVTLTGSLTNITRAHIHIRNASAGNPIAVFLQPRLNFTATPVLLDPPVSYKGTYNFVSLYDSDNIAAITPGWDLTTLLKMLSTGSLYVNVHTSAQPGGALQGTLVCNNSMCMWPLCSVGPSNAHC